MGLFEKRLLRHLASGPASIPIGIGMMTLTKLMDRGWAVPHDGGTSQERFYALTEKGRIALRSLDN